MTIGDRIKAARKDKGLTQKQLEELCGINAANIRKYESGRQNPKIETLQKIAEALDTSIFSLIEVDKTELFALVQNIDQTLLHLIKADYSTDTEFYKDFFDKKVSLAVLNSEEDQRLITAYYKLNEEGQQKAAERVEELTEIPKYKKE